MSATPIATMASDDSKPTALPLPEIEIPETKTNVTFALKVMPMSQSAEKSELGSPVSPGAAVDRRVTEINSGRFEERVQSTLRDQRQAFDGLRRDDIFRASAFFITASSLIFLAGGPLGVVLPITPSLLQGVGLLLMVVVSVNFDSLALYLKIRSTIFMVILLLVVPPWVVTRSKTFAACAAPPLLFLICRRQILRGKPNFPRFTTIVVSFFALAIGAETVNFFLIKQFHATTTTTNETSATADGGTGAMYSHWFWTASGIAFAATFVFVTSVHAVAMAKASKNIFLTRTRSLYVVLTAYTFTYNSLGLLKGIFYAEVCDVMPKDSWGCATETKVGNLLCVIYFVALIVVLVLRRRIFGWFTQVLKNRRKLEDGAFMASILHATTCYELGDAFWIHRKEPDVTLDGHARFFARGCIVNVTPKELVVAVPIGNPRNNAGLRSIKSTGSFMMGRRNSFTGKSLKYAKTADSLRPSSEVIKGAESLDTSTATAAAAAAAAAATPLTSENTLHTIAMLGLEARQQSAFDPTKAASGGAANSTAPGKSGSFHSSGLGSLVKAASKELRAISFERFSPELLRSSSSKDGDVDPYSLSESVKPGEIDYFVSHSWKDDPDQKFKALKRVAGDFHTKNGRWPRLWFDKCCINQQMIGQGLKLLPINVMASKRLLMLLGPTYTSRLWCVWELYVLFCFDPKDAGKRITVCPLAPSATAEAADSIAQQQQQQQQQQQDDEEAALNAALEGLSTFDVRQATCYDPNEQSKIMAVCESEGVADFNDLVRQLGQTIKSSAKRSLRGEGRSATLLTRMTMTKGRSA